MLRELIGIKMRRGVGAWVRRVCGGCSCGAWDLAKKDEGLMGFWWLCVNLRAICVAMGCFWRAAGGFEALFVGVFSWVVGDFVECWGKKR